MSDKQYVLFGSEYSPFSVKVRSYFRYKNIPHEWRPRTLETQAEFQKYAKLPLIPLVLGPDETVWQDSTPIIETFEEKFNDPALQPPSEMLAYLSCLIEDYGDEWVNKPMFHYRWWRPEDQETVSHGLARAINPKGDREALDQLAETIRTRMVPRLRFVGSSEKTKEVIEASLDSLLALLGKHLQSRPYLFGGRPALADFGLFAQVYGCLQQPTTAKIIRQGYPEITDWIDRMLYPKAEQGWEEWSTLAPTLEPLIKKQIGDIYLPWSLANEKAVKHGEEEFSLELMEQEFSQQTVKYAAKSIQVLRDRLVESTERDQLDKVLGNCGCLQPLLSPS
ncbi:glutathione S-transferase family protein [uncultured Sneathiella sp.]|uniref:glutathione S-transferase family protein n=1 Tax=uncultured Sneathiella sp. TaxID=879315 RepID=UPI002594D9E2|nr:glutathione S-transferase family protein [uncultured Sneathiella sp.]